MDSNIGTLIEKEKRCIEIVLRISDEVDEEYLRIIKKELLVEQTINTSVNSELFGSGADLYRLSYSDLVRIVEEDDLLASVNPIKYVFVHWANHWDEIKTAIHSSCSSDAMLTLDENSNSQNSDIKRYFEVQAKPYVNLFEIEVQRVSDLPLTQRICIPFSMKTNIESLRKEDVQNEPTNHEVSLPFSVKLLMSMKFHVDAETLSEDCTLRKIHIRYFDFDFEGYVRIKGDSEDFDTKQQIPISAISPQDHRSIKLLLEYIDVDVGHDKSTTTPSKYRVSEFHDDLAESEQPDSLIFDNKPRTRPTESGRRKNSVLTRRQIPIEKSLGMKSSNDRLNSVLAMPEFRTLSESAGSLYQGSKHLSCDETEKSEAYSSVVSVLGKNYTESSCSKLHLPAASDTSTHVPHTAVNRSLPQSPFFTGNSPGVQEALSLEQNNKILELPITEPSDHTTNVQQKHHKLLSESWFSQYIDKSSLHSALLLPEFYWNIEEKRKESWSTNYFPLPYIDGKQYRSAAKWKRLIRKGVPFSFRPSLYSILLSIESFLLTRPSYFFASICAAFPYFSTIEKSSTRSSKRSSGPDSVMQFCETGGSKNVNNPLFFTQAFPHFCPRSVPLFGMQKEEFSSLLVSIFREEGEIAVKTILCILCNQFPEFSYIPMLPALVCLLNLHLPSADKAAAAAYHCIATSAVCLGQRSRLESSEYLFKQSEEFNIFYAYLTLTETVHLSYLCTVYTLIKKHCPGLKISRSLPKLDIKEPHRVFSESDSIEQRRSQFVLLLLHALHSNFFTNVLPIPLCLIIVDGYLNEGMKVLVRYSVALMLMFGEVLLSENELLFLSPYSYDKLCKLIKSLRTKCHERFWNIESQKLKNPFEDLVDIAFALRIQRGHLSDVLTEKPLKKYVFNTLLSIRNDQDFTTCHKNKIPRSPLRYLFPATPYLTVRASFDLSSDEKPQSNQLSVSSDRQFFSSPSSIISTPMLWESFFTLLPSKVLINHAITRVYSTEKDGWSLQSLYQKCMLINSRTKSKSPPLRALANPSENQPTVILLSVVPCKQSAFDEHIAESSADTPLRRDLLNEIPASPLHSTPLEPSTPLAAGRAPVPLTSKPIRRFILGAFLSVPPTITTQGDNSSSFIGSCDTFVFTLHPHVSVYSADPQRTGTSKAGESGSYAANYFYGSANELRIGLGDSGSAIVLETDLHGGLTSPCKTFQSPQLLAENDTDTRAWERTQRFQVLQCEVLAFVEK